MIGFTLSMGQLFARFTHRQVDLSQLVYQPCSSGLMNCIAVTFYSVGCKILGGTAMDFPFMDHKNVFFLCSPIFFYLSYFVSSFQCI